MDKKRIKLEASGFNHYHEYRDERMPWLHPIKPWDKADERPASSVDGQLHSADNGQILQELSQPLKGTDSQIILGNQEISHFQPLALQQNCLMCRLRSWIRQLRGRRGTCQE